MARLLVIIGATAVLAGCQSQNPYAMFGPHRVPTPGTAAPTPYYPANVGAAPATPAPVAGTGRISVSAEAAPPLAASGAAANSANKESIRIVENPQPAIRTANSGASRNPGVSSTPAAPSSSGALQPVLPPATSGKSSQSTRLDTSVAPANYEQASSATGQWKAR